MAGTDRRTVDPRVKTVHLKPREVISGSMYALTNHEFRNFVANQSCRG
jgi:hypothetical protein